MRNFTNFLKERNMFQDDYVAKMNITLKLTVALCQKCQNSELLRYFP